MDPEQQMEWLRFEEAVLASERQRSAPEGLEGLFRVIIVPAFTPFVSWTICRKEVDDESFTYSAHRTLWMRDDDARKFLSPIERLRHRHALLAPTMEHDHVMLEESFVLDIMRRFAEVRISPWPAEHSIGLDGVTYELTVGDYFLRAEYQWWMSPPAGWEPLGEIVDDVLRHLNTLLPSSS